MNIFWEGSGRFWKVVFVHYWELSATVPYIEARTFGRTLLGVDLDITEKKRRFETFICNNFILNGCHNHKKYLWYLFLSNLQCVRPKCASFNSTDISQLPIVRFSSTSIFFIVINKLMKVFIEIESNKVSQEYHSRIYYNQAAQKMAKWFSWLSSFTSIASYSLHPP